MAATSITVVAHMTRDPEVRFTPSGKPVCSFGVAVSSRRKQGDEWVDGPTSFYNVSAWDALAQNVADSLAKGTRVVVTGRLSVREFEDREGAKRTSVEITADDVGASMRWATLAVEKADRAKTDESRASDPSEEVF
jgi:single-strand DNA-binding protein